jgi:hypothetical protein
MTMHVHCFFLGGVTFGELELRALCWCCLCCCKDWNTVAGLFFFSFFLFFSCVHPLCCCNWYHHDINIFPLLKKGGHGKLIASTSIEPLYGSYCKKVWTYGTYCSESISLSRITHAFDSLRSIIFIMVLVQILTTIMTRIMKWREYVAGMLLRQEIISLFTGHLVVSFPFNKILQTDSQ